MEEFEEEDLYDCEVYTYQVTHPEDSEEEVSQDDEEKIILLCPNCGFVYNFEDKPKDYRGREIDINNYILSSVDGYFRCPLCSKVVPYQQISEEEYNMIIDAKKKKEEARAKRKEKEQKRKEDAYFKINVSNFNKSLTEIQKDLEEKLFSGEISKNRFSYLYKNLVLKLYNKYEKIFAKCNRDFQRSDLIDTANKINHDVIRLYESKSKSDEHIDDLKEDLEDDELYIQEYREHIDERNLYEEDMCEKEYIREEKFKENQRKFEKRHIELEKEEQREKIKFEKEAKKVSEHNKARIGDLKESIKYKK